MAEGSGTKWWIHCSIKLLVKMKKICILFLLKNWTNFLAQLILGHDSWREGKRKLLKSNLHTAGPNGGCPCASRELSCFVANRINVTFPRATCFTSKWDLLARISPHWLSLWAFYSWLTRGKPWHLRNHNYSNPLVYKMCLYLFQSHNLRENVTV